MDAELHQRIKQHLKERNISRRAMARTLGLPLLTLQSYLNQDHRSGRAAHVETALIAYFRRTEVVEKQREAFIPLRTSQLILERCEEARQQREMVVLYGPPGISKTFALREYVKRRADAGDDKVLLITANAVTTPRALMVMLCRLLAMPANKSTHILVEDIAFKLKKTPHLLLIDEANHLNVPGLELMRHIHDLSGCGVVLVGTPRLYDVFTNGGRKSRDLEQLWSRVGIHDLLPGLTATEVRQIVKASSAHLNDAAITELQRTIHGSTRRLTKLLPRLIRLKELNPATPVEKLVPIAAGQIIANT